ncbi:fructosamine kinase family protein [Usitatibacter palustris]|uniref:Putative ketoamine kinase n=1 Tax=Usitatibacter palustris TaxID=2732487 RepID=A0A6M4H322_9PROT|nr:fructosamine kinase family protein [Usitatibacter palustris]QJR13478.1 putative ketoamine kinase [Usitatibacter palustris]
MHLDAALRTSLASALTDALEEVVTITDASAVSGGCIHRASRIDGEASGEKRAWFVKVNTEEHAAMFAAEADGLAALAKTGAVRVPKPITHGRGEDHAYLILEWLDLAPLSPASGAALGVALAQLHRTTVVRCGWPRDNFIGSSPQVNDQDNDWVRFWKLNRLHAQLRLAAHNKLPSKMIHRGERLVTDCDAFFTSYRPIPSLLHGDLWSGNASELADGAPAVFDPAVYHGDREADLAMTELFGGFPPDFKAAYRNAWPLDDGYPVRRDLYNLYHVLNHANLFGGNYVRDAEQRVERLLAEIR